MLTVYDILITRREMHACIIASCRIKSIFGNTAYFFFIFFILRNKKTKSSKENKRNQKNDCEKPQGAYNLCKSTTNSD